MTQLMDVGVAPVSGAEAGVSGMARGVRWAIGRLSTDNPFYVLSALLTLLGLWTSFGAQARAEQTWALMFGLGGYTLLLAAPACLLVRFGGVWQDVRTVLLLVVLMFLATSVTLDETLTRDPELGSTCFLAGLAFAGLVSEALLRVMRLKLPVGFRVPYHLTLALFFLYPIALLPFLHEPHSVELEWRLYGFPLLAGGVVLTLWPAVRRGAAYVRDNGSPWAWPYYPWALFVFLGLAVAARSWLLCVSMQQVERSVPERLIFGPYFLAPFLFAVALIVLEIGRVTRSRRVTSVAMVVPALATVLSGIGHRSDDLYLGFLGEFSERLGGSPLFLALGASAVFYAVAAWRSVPGALAWLSAALIALAFVSPTTRDVNMLSEPQFGPLLTLGSIQVAIGVWRREPKRCLLAVGCLMLSAWLGVGEGLGQTRIATAVAFHVGLAGLLAIGAAFDDGFSRSLRTLGATLVALSACAAATGVFESGTNLPGWSHEVYPAALSVGIACHGLLLRHRPSFLAAILGATAWATGLGWHAYASLRQTIVGLDAIAMGLVLLILAQLISLAKSGLLPSRGKGARNRFLSSTSSDHETVPDIFC